MNMDSIKNKFKPLHKPDYLLFTMSSFLIIISIIFSYSLTIYTVEYHDYARHHFFIRQFGVGVFSILIMWTLAHADPDKVIHKLGWILFVLFLAAMILMPFLPSQIVTASGGANRWIRLPGFSLSPVEFFKIGFIFFLAWSFQRRVMDYPAKVPLKEEILLLSPYLVAFLLVVFLVAFLQKDLGQVVLLGGVLIVMLIFANRSFKFFLLLGAAAIAGFAGLIIAAPHRIKRIMSWWSGVQDGILSIMPDFIASELRIKEFPEPYQVGHSLNAMNNGSWGGAGIGEGSIKLGFLSEVHTDFVLAGITEETGLVGFGIIVTVFFLIVWRIFRISRRIENPMYHLFSLGIGLMIIIAFLINSYGISGIIPIKGIAVPFLSYGGSSLLSVSISVGLVLSISRKISFRNEN